MSEKPLRALLNNSNQKTFIKSPNLPKNRVKDCIIGSAYANEIKELTELGINCIKLPTSPCLDEEISSHSDIQVFNLGNGKLIISKEAGEELNKKLSDFSFAIQENIKSPYPDDIKLNAAFIGNKIICNKNFISNNIVDFANENGIEIIHTKQGYSRCSLCIVNENAVITEDPGLAYLLKICQFDVLKIKPGYFYLSDKHTGFIGGASAKLSENELYFNGNIEKHPDFDQIKAFLGIFNISMIYNKSRKLTDFGGIIQLTELV